VYAIGNRALTIQPYGFIELRRGCSAVTAPSDSVGVRHPSQQAATGPMISLQ